MSLSMTHPRLLMIGMEKNTFDRLQVMCRANMVPLSTLYVINKNAVFFSQNISITLLLPISCYVSNSKLLSN